MSSIFVVDSDEAPTAVYDAPKMRLKSDGDLVEAEVVNFQVP